MKSLRNCLYIPFIFLLALVIIPQGMDAQRRKARQKKAADTLTADSLRPVDSLFRDSLFRDSLMADTLQADTAQEKKDALDAPVTFSSSDSIVMTSFDGFARMYGNAKVNYQNIELTAAVIAMNLDSSIVHANGVADTAGVLSDRKR